MSRSPGITLKIFAIAASILVLLIAIAINTHHKINIINAEIKALSGSILPISDQIDQAIIATLEQEIHLERILRIAEQHPLPDTAIQEQITEFSRWSEAAHSSFTKARNALENSETLHVAALPDDIKDAVNTLFQHNQRFQDNALVLLASIQDPASKDKNALGLTALLQLKNNENQLNKEGEIILEMLQNFAIATSQKASQHQQQILQQNVLLTVLAIVVGLLYSWFLAKRLSRPLEQLNQQVQLTLKEEEIQQIPVRGHDEVATLTRQFNAALTNLEHTEKLKDMFGQYLDPSLISHIETGEQNFKLDGERQSVTVLLTYIDNLDWQSEELAAEVAENPEKMVQAINQYLHLQTVEVGKYKGIVNFTLTDILVFWCHPFIDSKKHIAQAAEALVTQIHGMESFRQYIKQHFPSLKHPEKIQLRAGLASGELVVANMGPAGARAFTVIGDEVNAASRKAGIARFFNIDAVLSQQVAQQLDDNFICRPLGNLLVPGKEDIIHAAQFMGKRCDLSSKQLSAIESFMLAISAFHQRDFASAAEEFKSTLQVYKNDGVSLKYLAQCEQLRESELDENWQHIWQVDLK